MNRKSIVFTLLLIVFAPTSLFAASLESTFTSLNKKAALNPAYQSVCVQDGSGTAIVSHNADKSIIPASVSKLYTFDWALSKLPLDFRYTTTFYQDGQKLFINGGGDPHFVIEHLRSVLEKIQSERKVTITSITFSPDFYFNWKSTPKDISDALTQALQEETQVKVSKKMKVIVGSQLYKGKGNKYEFQSMPLPVLLKQINNYSTNISSDVLFKRLGGSTEFSKYMQETYQVSKDDITFETGSGLSGNHTTCALTLRVINHLANKIKGSGLALTDIMSMPSIDPGVLQKRSIDEKYAQSLVAKSGFVNFHHALAGAINTKTGPLFFAVFTDYEDLEKGARTKEMIDEFMNKLLKSNSKFLKSFQYEPDPKIFENVRIVRK